MMHTTLANDIRNQLQTTAHKDLYIQVKSRQCYYGPLKEVTIGNTVYYVTPIKSYTTVVAFLMEDNGKRVLVEIGKYSVTTSKQLTMLCREYSIPYRLFYDRITC